MRQFLRAGFSQINDASVLKSCQLYAFATPNQAAATETILSEEETLKLPIAVNPLPLPEVDACKDLTKELSDFIHQNYIYHKIATMVIRNPERHVVNSEDNFDTHVEYIYKNVLVKYCDISIAAIKSSDQLVASLERKCETHVNHVREKITKYFR